MKWLLILVFLHIFSFSLKSQPSFANHPKYNPGHYLGVQQYFDLTELPYLEEPAIKGVIKRYYWRDLEPDSAVYDFSAIADDLQHVKSLGKQLIVFIIDKSFDGSEILPVYLDPYRISDNSIVIANRWHPYVVDRLIALGQSISNQFDHEVAFEGLAIQETALSLSQSAMEANEYTPEIYRDALIELITGLADTLHSSQVFWYMNFLNGNNNYLVDIANAVKSYRVTIAGPDILPYRKGLQRFTYPIYDQLAGTMSLACAAQWDSYRHHKNDTVIHETEVHEEGYIPMQEIFMFGRDQLHLNYIFWQYIPYPPAPGAYNIANAMEVIRKYPNFNTITSLKKSACNEISLYPNPGNGRFFLKRVVPGLFVIIYNSSGEMIRSGIVTNHLIDLRGRPSGTYYLEAFDNYHTRFSSKLIIK